MILRQEKRDFWYIVVYSTMISLLGLVVPLSSQAIVNTVALGVFNSQLVILCAVVLVALVVLAVFTVLERYVIDLIQRRLFIRTASEFVRRLPMIRHDAWTSTYAPELVNRFFDVMTIQKSVGKLLMDGVNSILVLGTGLLLLGFYHPFFILYDIIFLLFIPILVFVLGRGAIPTALRVSQKKYDAAAWIEDVARNQIATKITVSEEYDLQRMDQINDQYVLAKHDHYIVIARQILGSYIFKAIATVGILGLGGILVIDQRISLGQLVAAEIVIILIIGAFEKLLAQFEVFYDLIAAVNKVSAVMEQPLEREGGLSVDPMPNGAFLSLRNINVSVTERTILDGLSIEIPSGARIALVGKSGAGKSTLLHLICGLEEPTKGVIRFNHVDIREADLKSLRKQIGLVFPEDQIITASVRDNILLGRSVPAEQFRWACRLLHLDRDVEVLPQGYATLLSPGAESIAFGLRRRILFARMIVERPNLLLLDEAFEGIEDNMKLTMLDDLFAEKSWTIVCVSHDPEIVRRVDSVFLIEDGKITESGSPSTLVTSRAPGFCKLFPEATRFLPNSSWGGPE
ncbi:MAG: ATP-binding cassette domain-containing protein [Ignavibacteriae bacterium]|nr:MAG: ATP-binding cassette domain-containing protein [Ignavibacteriota bacterium]